MADEIEVYQDRAKEWRWRLIAPNGEIIADSNEGYDSKYNANRAAKRVFAERTRQAEEAGADATGPAAPTYRQNIVRND